MVTENHGKHTLARRHREILEKSKIAPDLMETRGVSTVRRSRDLPEVFSERQRRRGPGILFTVHRPDGETSFVFRPDATDSKNPGCKYEVPPKKRGGPGNVLDIHPYNRDLITDMSVPVIFVEGIKKADSLSTAFRAAGKRALVGAVSGVWNWLSEGEPIPDMYEIPVEGRKVIICFDSDLLTNPNVQDATGKLAEHLKSRGAEVWITFFHDAAGGSKQGADDFFAAGGTVEELRMLTRRYDPADFARIHMSRDEQLRAGVEDLERRWWDYEWARVVGTGAKPHSMRGHTCRDAMRVLIDAAGEHGKVVPDGVAVSLGRRTLARRAASSLRTIHKTIGHLEAEGWLRFEPPKDEEKAGGYVLLTPRANLHHMSTERVREEKATQKLQSVYGGGEGLRAPRLRWGAPTFAREGKRVIREYIRRLGKINGSIIDRLDRDGAMSTGELAEALHRRTRDLRRRNLPKLVEAGIVQVDGDTVSLAADWQRALLNERLLSGEIAAEMRDERRHRRQSKAFRERHKHPPMPHWTQHRDADGCIENLRRPGEEDETKPKKPAPPPLSPEVEELVKTLMRKNFKLRLGLIEEIALDGGLPWRDVRKAVRRMGYRVERLPEYRNAEFVYTNTTKKAA